MPPRCQIVPVVLTLDALETVIQVTGGAGYQYWCAARQFLSRTRPATTAPSLSPEPEPSPDALNAFNAAAIAIIRESMKTARHAWGLQHPGEDPKTMPIGGTTDEELVAFWEHVLARVFTELTLPGLGEADRARLHDLAASAMALSRGRTPPTALDPAWEAFLRTVVFERFGSTEGHSWLPAGQRTLTCVREWNAAQWQRVQASVAAGAEVHLWPPSEALDSAPASAPVLVLARAPALVSNMDPRLARVMKQLGALSDDPHQAGAAVVSAPLPWEAYAQQPDRARAWPLISEVITARDAGRAKPSTAGLRLAAQHAGVDDSTVPHAMTPYVHIHVGDAEADRLACEALPCRFLSCDGGIGVEWEALLAELTNAEAALGDYMNRSF